MPSIYGMPAVEVEQPDGEIVLYPVTPLPALPDEWQAFRVTSPKGEQYRVVQFPSGRWACDCPAHTIGKNRGGRWHKVKQNPVCKHIQAVHQHLEESSRGDQGDRRAGQGLARHAGPGSPDPALGEHNSPAHQAGPLPGGPGTVAGFPDVALGGGGDVEHDGPLRVDGRSGAVREPPPAVK